MPVMEKPGDRAALNISGENPVHAELWWGGTRSLASIDMDLHSMALPKKNDDSLSSKKKGWLTKTLGGLLGESDESKNLKEIHVYHGYRGYLEGAPYIKLDRDSGIGGRIDGADKESNMENIYFSDIKKYDIIAVCVNNFGATTFKEANCKLTVNCDNQNLEIPIVETKRGSWLLAAAIDNRGNEPILININKVYSKQPTVNDAIKEIA